MAETGSEKARGRGRNMPMLEAEALDEEGRARVSQGVPSTPMTQSGTPPMTQLLKSMQYLVEHCEEQKALPALLMEYRDTLVEACTTWESQGREMTSLLDRIHQRLSQEPTPPGRRRWLPSLVSGTVGALVVGLVWFWWPAPPLAQLGASLNQTIVQQYAQLPKPVQESLTVAYKRTGFQAPVDQLKGGK